MIRYKVILTAVLLVVITFFVSIAISYNTVAKMTSHASKENATILASKIYDNINAQLQKPIIAATALSRSEWLIDLLQNEDKYSSKEIERKLKKAFENFDLNTEYNTIFAVSEKSRRYYTQNGFNKIVNPETDKHDIWYNQFLDLNQKYDFDIDIDEVNNNIWTVFLNSRIENSDGTLLGVGGVGLQMTELQQTLTSIENDYNIQINLVDSSGLVQVDVNDTLIENKSLNNIALDKRGKDFLYTKTDNGYVITRYMDALDWYLVIRNDEDITKKTLTEIVHKHILVTVIILLIILIVSSLVMKRSQDKFEEKVSFNSYRQLAKIYKAMFLLDLRENTTIIIKLNMEHIPQEEKINHQRTRETMREKILKNVEAPYRDAMLDFVNEYTLVDRLKANNSITCEFNDKHMGRCRARFISASDNLDKEQKVIFAIEDINCDC